LARTINALTAQPDVDTFLGHVLRAIREQFQADAFGIELYDAAHDRMIPRFAYIGDQPVSTEELRDMGVTSMPASEHRMWQTLLKEPRPFASYDVANDPRLMYRDVVVGLGATSNLVAPLLLGDEPIGFISILNKDHRRYGPEEMELAQALAQQATLAVILPGSRLRGKRLPS
jgi:GAF domain-containing protein